MEVADKGEFKQVDRLLAILSADIQQCQQSYDDDNHNRSGSHTEVNGCCRQWMLRCVVEENGSGLSMSIAEFRQLAGEELVGDVISNTTIL
jgi:hypothetical protein